MLKVGLTGGIGSGKTFVAEIMKRHGFPVFDADSEAKKLYSNPEVVAEVGRIFGESVFVDGKIDFGNLAKAVFTSPELLQKLNDIIHPLVRQNFTKWAEEQSSDVAVMESAIVFESDLQMMFDKIIVVDAPEEVRVERIKKRNPNWSGSEIRRRIASQMPQSEKCALADFVIINDGKSELESQILKIKSLL